MTSGAPTPHKDVVAGASPGIFVARGDDPQMIWTAPRTRDDLRTHGAIRVTVTLRAVEGRVIGPCIYADWGDGFSEETRKDLTLVSEGVYTGVAYTNAGGLRRLRFDPSAKACQFSLEAFSVEPAAESSRPARRLSTARRLARRLLRRLPGPVQAQARSLAGLLRGDLVGRLTRTRVRWGGGPWRAAYVNSFEIARNLRSPEFAAPPLDPPRRSPDGPKVIAFYLPQFHPIPENDAWWGKGFTEWTNVSKATPQFVGHLQPRLPAELGHYDLRVPEVRRAQADLARRVGVDAFCFHYYWFAGKRLLEGPLDAFVDDPEIDLPFALCWANENWTRRWDGQESDVLISQRHSPQDDILVFDDLARYLRSPRYLRVGGRPLIIIYRPDALPEAGATIARWRERARELGLGELFVTSTDAFGFSDYAAMGFDALVEFPPHALAQGEITDRVERLNPAYSGRVYDYEAVASAKVEQFLDAADPRRFPGIMPAWDNEARKPGAGHVFHNASPELFHRWAGAALGASARLARPDERLVFVNAWNEWAEGAYLEPDRWFGHAFGQALRAALEADAPRLPAASGRPDVVSGPTGRAPAVVLLHLYYPDLIEAFANRLAALDGLADIAITFPDTWTPDELARLAAAFPSARLAPTPNVGRDIAPFIAALGWARQAGYPLFCKLHSKRSPHLAQGDAWREALLSPLLGAPAAAIAQLQANADVGLLAAGATRTRLGTHGVMHNNAGGMAMLASRLGFAYGDDTEFPAGTMFWGRTAAFGALTQGAPLPFELELGRIDGTLAHALERAMGAIVAASGHRADWSL